mgnify:CR=1 FL=1
MNTEQEKKTPDTMVRYGRDKRNQRKNCLHTIRKDGAIYFGVSRCRTKSGDVFSKELAVAIAEGRTMLARDALFDTPGSAFLKKKVTYTKSYEKEVANIPVASLTREVFCGKIPDTEIKELLSWFRGLDSPE